MRLARAKNGWSRFDANGVTTQLTLDALGRVKQRDIIGGPAAGTHTFEWDTIKAGLLSSSTANGVKKTYSYNTALQPLTESVEIDGVARTVNYQYDTGIGRLKGLQYPNGLTIAYEYNATGYLQKIKNAATGYTYKNITAMDAEGHVTDASLANGNIASKNHYNPDGTMAYTQATSAVMGVIHNIGYTRYDSFMNPLEETNYSAGETQTYSYDNMNRLVSYSLLRSGFSPITVNYGYTATGNFQYKSDFSTATNGAYQYGGSSSCLASQFAGPNAVCQVTKANNSVVTYQYDKAGNLTSGDGLTSIQYDANHMPINISGRGANSAFVYDADGARARQTLSTGGRTKTTYYVGKLFEADADGAWRAYIDDVAILSYSPEGAASLQFTLRDRLGSAVTIADGNGMLVSRRFFDPFGKSGNIGTDQVSTNRNRRGFTDHEHLLEQSLIHMNGRVYDQNLGRFLSVDPFIQEPTSTQNINAYSYVLNNPLTGTDPTGYTRLDALREKSIEKFDNFMSTKADDIKSMQVTENGSKLTFAVNMKDGSSKSLTAAGKLSDVGGQLESSKANGPPSHKPMPENLNDFTNGDMTFPQGTNPPGAKQEIAEIRQAAAEYWGWGESSGEQPLDNQTNVLVDPEKYVGKSYRNKEGVTECVEFAKQAAGAGYTQTWRFGEKPTKDTPRGTWIATPGSDGKFYGHVGAFLSIDKKGNITMLDQYKNKQKISPQIYYNKPDSSKTRISNDASNYRIVIWK
jgi:RHS repeat-associated protein